MSSRPPRRPRLPRAAAAAVLVLLAAPDARAQAGGEPRALAVERCASPPVIDGVLEESVWGAPPAGDMLLQVEPVPGAPPTQRTVFRLLRDDDHLYVGVWCFDSDPERIRATQVARDANLDPDARVEILVDTFGDKQNAFWFQVGPAGGKGDALISRAGSGFRKDWDGLFRAGSSVDENGWYAEFALPAATLAFDPASDDWRFNLRRFVRRDNEEARWSGADPKLRFFNTTHAGELSGMAGLSQGIGLDLRPFATATYLDRDGDTDLEADAGLDLFWKVSPSTRLSASINTDFAEAEVDDRQVNLTRFSLFFPEKRDFFLEDDGLFAFGSTDGNSVVPYFSRRIGLFAGEEVPIVAAAKLTDRTQDHAFGLLHVVTDSTDGPDALDSESLSVARGSYFFGQQSEVGFLGTFGAPDGTRDAATFGADLALRTDAFLGDKNLSLSGYLVGSNQEDGRGEAWFAELDYPNDEVSARLRHWNVDEDFDPALGFVRRPGTRRTLLNADYRPRLYSDVRSLDFGVTADHVEDRSGRTESERLAFTVLGVEWETEDRFTVDVAREREVLFEPFEISDGVVVPSGDFDWWSVLASVGTSDHRPLSASASVEVGDFYDGEAREFGVDLEWRPGSRANFELGYELRDIELAGGAFDVHLARFGSVLALSRTLSLTGLVQYDSVSDDASVNARLRWIVEPGNELFVVVDQAWNVLAGEVDPRRTSATVKLGWTFRF